MDVQEFAKRMMGLMPQCRRDFFRYEHAYLSRGKISMPQFDVLEYLSSSRREPNGHRDACLMSELAKTFHISKPAATGLIDRLIAQKLVERLLSAKDRRVVKVRLTAKGRQAVSSILERRRQNLVKIFAHISASDRRQYVKTLEQVVQILKQKILMVIVLVGMSAAFPVSLGLADETPASPVSPAGEPASVVVPRESFTLQDCYALALKRSEQLAIAKQTIQEAEGRFLQSLSGALPKLSFNYSHEYQQGENEPESKFTFSQPLFSGFKEFAAMAASRAEGRQFRQEESRARQLLLVDVADAFYFYGFYQEHLELTQGIIQALEDRMEELKKRVELGRSRASELASAQARLRRAEAQAEQTRADLGVARELLEFLTGKTILSVRDDLDVPMTPKTSEELAFYVPGRADVLAAREAVTVARKKAAVAQAGYWPSVSVEGNSYTQKTTGNPSDWDVTLKMSVPIFQGTQTLGKVHEASALATQAELELSETTRRALMEIRQAYVRWESSYNRAAALKKAVDAAEENYQLQAADYRLSMVNNLDVLQALADLHDVRRDYIDAVTDLKRFYWNFKVKTGDLKDVHL